MTCEFFVVVVVSESSGVELVRERVVKFLARDNCVDVDDVVVVVHLTRQEASSCQTPLGDFVR